MASTAKENEALFKTVGLNPKLASAVVRNAVVSTTFREIIEEAGVQGGCDRTIGNLLYTMASDSRGQPGNRKPIIELITAGDIKTPPQVKAAMAFVLKSKTPDLDVEALKTAAGVGVEYTLEEIRSAIQTLFTEIAEDLKEERYRMLGEILSELRERLPWVNGKLLKDEVEAALLNTLGPKTPEDSAPSQKKQKKKKKSSSSDADKDKGKKQKKKSGNKQEQEKSADGDDGTLKPPTDAEDLFLEGRPIEEAKNTPEQFAAHRARTGGRVITRFPPEPNGYLHIGHAKAIFFNFKVAADHGGECLLRFDDTNPETEEQEFIDSIIDNVEWLGNTPSRITYSSDYFHELHDLAVKLIQVGKAYVCHQTAEEIKQSRKDRTDSPWRNRSVEENLKLFADMRKGKFAEGAATLRMKGDMQHPNPQMWDMIAYRIKYTAHPRTGDEWCIYPSYDFTHCIVDSLEDITHSLCTLEFEIRRESYYWLLHQLDLYKPRVWEYSRLNISNTVLSKRKLKALVQKKIVDGWEDPRILTINGLRRRGYTPEVIRELCRRVGVSRNDNVIRMDNLEHCARDVFNRTAPRAMVVSDPLEVEILNFPEGEVEILTVPDFPSAVREENDPEAKDGQEDGAEVVGEKTATHQVPLTRRLWIERKDFQLQPNKKFFGLGPGRTAHLKYAHNITVQEVVMDPEQPDRVQLLRCTMERDSEFKPKGKLHWVAEPQPGVSPLKVQLNMYSTLFLSESPDSNPGGWLADVNPESLTVMQDALADPSVGEAELGKAFQFERLGYFSLDSESKKDGKSLIFNRVVELKARKLRRDMRRKD